MKFSKYFTKLYGTLSDTTLIKQTYKKALDICPSLTKCLYQQRSRSERPGERDPTESQLYCSKV
jgi:hypothetical protein